MERTETICLRQLQGGDKSHLRYARRFLYNDGRRQHYGTRKSSARRFVGENHAPGTTTGGARRRRDRHAAHRAGDAGDAAGRARWKCASGRCCSCDQRRCLRQCDGDFRRGVRRSGRTFSEHGRRRLAQPHRLAGLCRNVRAVHLVRRHVQRRARDRTRAAWQPPQRHAARQPGRLHRADAAPAREQCAHRAHSQEHLCVGAHAHRNQSRLQRTLRPHAQRCPVRRRARS
jgi:hypothetical protein